MVSLERIKTKRVQKIFHSHRVSVAYLFGSYAKHTDLPISDIDIGVLFDFKIETQEYPTLQIGLTTDLISALEKNSVDVVVLNVAPPLLRYKVFADGKILFCDSELARVRFEVKAMRDYFDTKKLRETLKKAYLRRSA